MIIDNARYEYHDHLRSEVACAIKSLWADDGVQQCFKRAYEYQLNDSGP